MLFAFRHSAYIPVDVGKSAIGDFFPLFRHKKSNSIHHYIAAEHCEISNDATSFDSDGNFHSVRNVHYSFWRDSIFFQLIQKLSLNK